MLRVTLYDVAKRPITLSAAVQRTHEPLSKQQQHHKAKVDVARCNLNLPRARPPRRAMNDHRFAMLLSQATQVSDNAVSLSAQCLLQMRGCLVPENPKIRFDHRV